MAFFNLPCKEYEVIMASYNYIVLFAFTTMYIYLTAKNTAVIAHQASHMRSNSYI